MNNYNKLIFDYQTPGHSGYDVYDDQTGYDVAPIIACHARKQVLNLPCASELETVRHYTNLSFKNFGVENGFYPLGSCTMKYNPHVNEVIAANPAFTRLHPLSDEASSQGSLAVIYELSNLLQIITGMSAMTLNPFAGAQGELTGLMIIKQYHLNRKDFKRTKMIIPDSAHGTNPASSHMCGFEVVNVESTKEGRISLVSLKTLLSDEVAGIMMTNPNTLGMFEEDVLEITKLVHACGGLVYYDGANLNAIIGQVRPEDMGVDVLHLNLHKTFATPHGGGGPGSGPVGVRKGLEPLLPNPQIAFDGQQYYFVNSPESIGRIAGFYGNFGVYIKALAYLKTLGAENLAMVSKLAVLNANYIKESLKDDYDLWISEPCKHEVVFAGLKDKSKVTTLDVAKRLLDYGYHAPTIYFPLIVDQAMMIEPTETESKQTIDEFIAIMHLIAQEARDNPELVKSAPHQTSIKRIDEVLAARHPILTYQELSHEEG